MKSWRSGIWGLYNLDGVEMLNKTQCMKNIKHGLNFMA